MVVNVISNGSARLKFYEWIYAQGGNIDELRVEAKRIDVKSEKKGYVKSINASEVGLISSLLTGKSKDLNTGIVLRKNIGEFVEKDEVIASIYYNKEVNNMISIIRNAYELSNNPIKEKNIILKIIK